MLVIKHYEPKIKTEHCNRNGKMSKAEYEVHTQSQVESRNYYGTYDFKRSPVVKTALSCWSAWACSLALAASTDPGSRDGSAYWLRGTRVGDTQAGGHLGSEPADRSILLVNCFELKKTNSQNVLGYSHNYFS